MGRACYMARPPGGEVIGVICFCLRCCVSFQRLIVVGWCVCFLVRGSCLCGVRSGVSYVTKSFRERYCTKYNITYVASGKRFCFCCQSVACDPETKQKHLFTCQSFQRRVVEGVCVCGMVAWWPELRQTWLYDRIKSAPYDDM